MSKSHHLRGSVGGLLLEVGGNVMDMGFRHFIILYGETSYNMDWDRPQRDLHTDLKHDPFLDKQILMLRDLVFAQNLELP